MLMADSNLLVNGFLAHFACQSVVCAFVATLMGTLSRWQTNGLMLWWSVSWAAQACYIACAGFSLYLVVGGARPEDPSRVVVGGFAIASAALQVYALAKGWQAERNDTNHFSRQLLLRLIVGITLLAFAVAVLLHVFADSRTRFLCKVSLRAVVIAVVYFWIGVAVLRRTSLIRTIRVWLGLGLIAFGLKHLHYTYQTVFHAGEVTYEDEYLLQFIELGLHTVIASPMLLWVCLRFRDESNSQTVELQRRATMLEEQDVLLSRRQRLSSIGRVAAGVAHDFNNVLSVIQGWTDILRHESKLDDLGREGVTEIESAAEQAGAISQQLMLFGGRRQLDPVLVTVKDAIDEARRLAPQCEGRRFSVDVPDSVPMIRGDRPMLVAALQNLMINACDATRPDGSIQIKAEYSTFEGEQLGSLDVDAGEYVVISVIDDGVGIPIEEQEHIFEPFFTTKDHGNGLGLPSVHGFARQSGGAVTIESAPGRGTTIRLILPLATKGGSEKGLVLPVVEIHPPTSHTQLGNAQLMVVDDEPSIARHAARVLQRAGFSVVQHTSPEEALTHAIELGDQLSVVITDIRMPTMSGAQLAKKLAAAIPGLRVVFVTGYANEIDFDAVGLSSRPSVLQKPIQALDLLEAVRHQLHESATKS